MDLRRLLKKIITVTLNTRAVWTGEEGKRRARQRDRRPKYVWDRAWRSNGILVNGLSITGKWQEIVVKSRRMFTAVWGEKEERQAKLRRRKIEAGESETIIIALGVAVGHLMCGALQTAPAASLDPLSFHMQL